MKVRKNVIAWIGIVLCLAVAGVIFAIPAINNVFALLPAALFVPLVIMLGKADSTVEEEEEGTTKKVRWPLVICWTSIAFAALATIMVAIFCGWWFLIPLACVCALLIWLGELLLWPEFWRNVFVVCIIIAIVLFGVFCIVATVRGNNNNNATPNHVGDLYVDNLHVDDATIGTLDVEDENVNNQKVENQQAENSSVNNQTVNNQVVTNQTVGSQTVEDQTTPTEPETQPTEPETKPSEPKPTEPVHTHNYNSAVTEPTCMEQGYTTHTCSCGHSYKDSYKGALGHSYKSTVVAPTTESGGYTEYKCERCGHTYKSDFTDKLPEPTEPQVPPAIKCAKTIRYGEVVYVNLEGISASNLKVSNKAFVSVEKISDSRVAITLTEDVTGYITITDSASGTNVVIDIAE